MNITPPFTNDLFDGWDLMTRQQQERAHAIARYHGFTLRAVQGSMVLPMMWSRQRDGAIGTALIRIESIEQLYRELGY